MQTQTQPLFKFGAGNPETIMVVNVDAVTARRTVNGWAMGYVSTSCMGDTPMLITERERPLWRVPVVFTRIGLGIVDEIGTMSVDAQTGELLDATEQRADALRDNAVAISKRLKAEGYTFQIRHSPTASANA